MILGGSGFIGNGLYRELSSFYNVHATYFSATEEFDQHGNFHQWDVQQEPLSILLQNVKPDIIISAIRADFEAQISAHFEAIDYVLKYQARLVFLSSANVFDAFTNFPSYEYDKTFSYSIYGRFKIAIENALLRLPNECYTILRLPMVFGAFSPRVNDLKTRHRVDDPIEVFPNVVVNATYLSKLTQQVHFLINHNASGVFHLGSSDLIHHSDLILEICEKLALDNPRITQVYESNDDRFLAILPRDNPLPDHLTVTTQAVIDASVINV